MGKYCKLFFYSIKGKHFFVTFSSLLASNKSNEDIPFSADLKKKLVWPIFRVCNLKCEILELGSLNSQFPI